MSCSTSMVLGGAFVVFGAAGCAHDQWSIQVLESGQRRGDHVVDFITWQPDGVAFQVLPQGAADWNDAIDVRLTLGQSYVANGRRSETWTLVKHDLGHAVLHVRGSYSDGYNPLTFGPAKISFDQDVVVYMCGGRAPPPIRPNPPTAPDSKP